MSLFSSTYELTPEELASAYKMYIEEWLDTQKNPEKLVKSDNPLTEEDLKYIWYTVADAFHERWVSNSLRRTKK